MDQTAQLTDNVRVAEQYATTDNLRTRRDVWGPGPEGVSPVDILRTLVVAGQHRRVLEIGCGTGQFARSVLDVSPDTDYLATDLSPAMVAATHALGVAALTTPADALPFDDGAFDGAVAAWMLYHVPDLDPALGEVRRVLRDGGAFYVATNGREHLADLLREAGGAPLVTQFTSEVAADVLGRHFAAVSQRDIETRATFPDHASAQAYLATFAPHLAAALPPFEGPRTYAGHTAVLTAR
ncbi:class I SAM-dependent methyltransferase [Terrabacter terrigena]|uniref:Class I SAM-dependent methyltransferase n=1 Tax=Terrabacter terrigena TaxID=574718 RepID=A0ABW3N117_9MICO